MAPTGVAGSLGAALDYPATYFSVGAPPLIGANEVRFRAARRATARERDAAVAAGVSGIEIDRWISTRFVLPPVDVPSFTGHAPATAAQLLRAVWGLGTKPLPNLVQLCESRGIRVYTLPPLADAVDAYSLWRDDIPYVFLHLVLHGEEACDTSNQEREADAFASEFLLPAASVAEYLPNNPSLPQILMLRDTFKTSAMATAFACHKAGRLSDWAYRQTCVELSTRGYRTSEPDGMPNYEMSRVFPQVLDRTGAVHARTIAGELHLPVSDVHALTFGTELRSAQSTEVNAETARRGPTGRHLRMV
ncbi:Zn-dependent peptidase ImmA (M78 family) [Nocardia puris]|uniref:Zn-dependent peptidase ImmA (M78 family) n=1 Tax=Nocardia puris TaxID=208602 RepID=A0A366D2I1_9NOCA|nr:Zn-dependent peptidase ImmA (M78 family) [Nocardia puris]